MEIQEVERESGRLTQDEMPRERWNKADFFWVKTKKYDL
jgi:hypothetical protein